MREGGWESEAMVDNFTNYVKYVMERLGDSIPYVCTINEANMGLQVTKIMKDMQKAQEGSEVQVGLNLQGNEDIMVYYQKLAEAFQVSNPMDIQTFLGPRTLEGDRIIMKCHMAARAIIRKISPSTKVGITFSLMDYQPLARCEAQAQKEWEDDFLHYLYALEGDDFFGLQNYTRKVIGEDGSVKVDGARLTQSGYELLSGSPGRSSKIFIKAFTNTYDNLRERIGYLGG